jgi:hypothetical protein
MMLVVQPADLLKAQCRRRYGHAPLLRDIILADVEKLLRGKRALFLEQYADLREEILWFVHTYRITLVSQLNAA